MIILKLQFDSKYQVNNLIVHTSRQTIPYTFEILICELEILKKISLGGVKLYLKQKSFQGQIVLQKYSFDLKKLLDCKKVQYQTFLTHYWSTMLKWFQILYLLWFLLLSFIIYTYTISIDLEMLHEFWKKLKKTQSLSKKLKLSKVL